MKDQLREAVKIQQEIDEINSFLSSAEKVWTGRLSHKTFKNKFAIISDSYGIFDEKELEMNTKLKNKILDVLREEANLLTDQLKHIMGGAKE